MQNVNNMIIRTLDSVTNYLTSGRKDVREKYQRELPLRSKWLLAAVIIYDCFFHHGRIAQSK